MFVNIGTKRNKWFEIDGTVTSEPDLDMVPQHRGDPKCAVLGTFGAFQRWRHFREDRAIAKK